MDIHPIFDDQMLLLSLSQFKMAITPFAFCYYSSYTNEKCGVVLGVSDIN